MYIKKAKLANRCWLACQLSFMFRFGEFGKFAYRPSVQRPCQKEITEPNLPSDDIIRPRSLALPMSLLNSPHPLSPTTLRKRILSRIDLHKGYDIVRTQRTGRILHFHRLFASPSRVRRIARRIRLKGPRKGLSVWYFHCSGQGIGRWLAGVHLSVRLGRRR